MKETILALVLAVMSSGSWADWQLIAKTEIGSSYIDPTTVSRTGQYGRAWILVDRQAPSSTGDMSSRKQVELDCGVSQVRTRNLLVYYYSEPMAQGKASFVNKTPSDWVYFDRGTVAAEWRKYVCPR